MAKPSRVAATDAEVLDRVLGIARRVDYEGYSKHDALNAPVLERLAGSSRARRLVATQLVMRSPIDVRPMVGVHKARNPKGIALFARALLARSRLSDSDTDRAEARALLDWLVDHPSPEFAPGDATARFTGLGWGYPYPWQDVGFFAPRHFPNRVVTSFAGQALLDGFETLHEPNYLDAAQRVAQFLLDAPKTLYEDVDHRCLSYVPDESVTWIVMDVSALVGAFVARLGAFCDDARLLNEGGRLVRYVVSKQTEEGRGFSAEPPSASHITHDNYHTGFILDAIQCYSLAARSDEFDKAYLRGIEFYERRLFEPGGAARFMSDRLYPIDIHGCAQGVLTFSLQQKHAGTGGEQARKVLDWTLAHMWDPRSGWFYYQKRRAFRTKIRELRWCQAWMAWALACHLECCGTAS